MKILSWNAHCGRGTAAAIELADRLAADVLMLQEATSAEFKDRTVIGAVVPGCTWGSWITVRVGSLEPIAIEHYLGWVAGAQWFHDPGDCTYLFSIHSPTSYKNDIRGSYVTEAGKI